MNLDNALITRKGANEEKLQLLHNGRGEKACLRFTVEVKTERLAITEK